MSNGWYVSKEGRFGNYKSSIFPEPDDWTSYYERFVFEGNVGSIITYFYKSAEGKVIRVKHDEYEIRIVGKHKDALKVLRKLEGYFDPVDLNNMFNLPNLPDWVERLKYLINWIRTGQR